MAIAHFLTTMRQSFRKGAQSVVPLAVLIIYTFIGAAIFYFIEKDNEQHELEVLRQHRTQLLDKSAKYISRVIKGKNLDSYQLYNQTYEELRQFQKGLEGEEEEEPKWSFTGAIFYCITVYTTIGYGNITPKTGWGRAVTIIYAFIGIPLAVLCMYALGQVFARLCKVLWKGFLRGTRVVSKDLEQKVAELGEKDESAQPDASAAEGDDLLSFPIWILLIFTVLWILFCALMFFLMESDWSYGTSLYFTLITFTTIGFGDVLPSDYSFIAIIAVLIIFGLAIVSTILTIIQQQIEALTDDMKKDIDKQYINALMEAADEGEVNIDKNASVTAEGQDVEAVQENLHPHALNSVVSRMPMKSRVLFHLMPANSKKQLNERNEMQQGRKTRGCQTEDSLLQDLVTARVQEEILKIRLAHGGQSPSAPASPILPPPQPSAYETSLQ